MKRTLLIALLAGAMSAVSCEELGGDWIVDWTPVSIYINAVDSEGNSIISPDMPGMSLTFKGVEYPVQDVESARGATKAYLAIIHGLLAVPQYEIDGKTVYQLVFGEIDGAADMDEDIVLTWPDGSRDTIHYHCSDHREGRHPTCKRSWKLNGKAHDGGIFSFTGKS
ncbi:MAG: hypothetical protein K6F58_06585 [Bacteroidales bacterium]|nr:hypothetical protein [Bacteroidales bacterium]